MAVLAGSLLVVARSPVAHAAVDGRWSELGVPMRPSAQLLWDAAEQRLVVFTIGVLSVNDLPEPWEFRTATGWRRLELPPPPFVQSPYQYVAPVIADPAHWRFIAFEQENGRPRGSPAVWSLELGPPVRWTQLGEAGPPAFTVSDAEVDDEWLWAVSSSQTTVIWKFPLTGAGTWDSVRAVPTTGSVLSTVIDSARQRALTISYWDGHSDTLRVFEAPLLGNTAPTPLPVVGQAPSGFSGNITVLRDPARDRILLIPYTQAWPESTPVWALTLGATPAWSVLAVYPFSLFDAALGIAGDTLWVHGANGSRPGLGPQTLTIPLVQPDTWTIRSDPVWPTVGSFAAILRDRAHGRWIGAGGLERNSWSHAVSLDTLWALRIAGDAATWELLHASGAGPPPERSYAAWATDEAAGVAYLCNGGRYLYDPIPRPEHIRDVWALHLEDPPRWSLVSGADESPTWYEEPAFAFDPVGRRLIYFGATVGDSAIQRIWTFAVDSLSGWRAVVPAGTPPPDGVEGATAVYDPLGDRIVFNTFWQGGLSELRLRPHLRWVTHSFQCAYPLVADTCLPRANFARGFFDPIGERILEWGGTDFSFEPRLLDGVWSIAATETLGPVGRLEVAGTPGSFEPMPAVYDPSRDALLAFGGLWQPSLIQLRFQRHGSTSASLGEAVANADRVTLRWSAAPGAALLLWRRTGDEDWHVLSTLTASAVGELAYDDRAIESGRRYGYRLTAASPPFALASEDVWIAASTSPSFSLAHAWPNPSRGPVHLSFTLARSAEARLELFDIAGRRVWSTRLAGLAPGPHHVLVDLSRDVRPGLYLVRLKQRELAATTRVILAR